MPALGLRKESQRIGPLRVVSVEDFDVSACGGTHVRRTGEIGSIVIRKVERVNRQARVEFVCGRRSVVSGQRDLETLSLVARQLSVGLSEVPARVEKQIQESRQLRKTLQVKNKMLAGLLAKELYAQVQEQQGSRIVKQLFEDEEMEFLKLLAQALVSSGELRRIAGLGWSRRPRCYLPKAITWPGDLRQILPACCQLIEGKGGGTRTLVQAGGKNTGQLQQALDLAEQQITDKNALGSS